MEQSDTVVLGLRAPVHVNADTDWRATADGSASRRLNEFDGQLRAARRAGGRVRAWVVAAAFAASLAAVAGAYCLADQKIGRPVATLAWGAAGALLVLAVTGLVIRARQLQRQRELELEVHTERDIRGLVWSVERRDLWELAALSSRQMTRFECLAVAQARTSFTAAVFAAAAALAVLVAGAAVTFMARGTDTAATVVSGAALTAAGSALSGFLSWTFLRAYRMTAKQLSFFYGQPLVNCYLLHAERMLEATEPDQRREGVQRLVDAVVRSSETAQAHIFELSRAGGRLTPPARQAASPASATRE